MEPLLTGRVRVPEASFLREEGRLAWRKAIGLGVSSDQLIDAPVPCFLVEHPGAGHILVDTGFHPAVAVKPRENLGRVVLLTVFKEVRMEPEQAAPAQLRERGIEPSAVNVVVMTDLHNDHASAISEFSEATFVLSRAEWEAAKSSGQIQGYVRRQFDHAFDYRLLDFAGPDAGSFSGFARSFDLFGDGSVRVVYTPGHSAGHQSVIVRLSDREALLAGDAIYFVDTLDHERRGFFVADEHNWRRSLREIQLYRRENPDAVIIPSHDPGVWEEVPETYV
jgi:glyoxylase-like metal-dependent hydrolase (beta-lactamase superfamily II)